MSKQLNECKFLLICKAEKNYFEVFLKYFLKKIFKDLIRAIIS